MSDRLTNIESELDSLTKTASRCDELMAERITQLEERLRRLEQPTRRKSNALPYRAIGLRKAYWRNREGE